MQNDPLTDMVRSLDLAGGVFLEASLTAPWAIDAHVSNEDCRPFMVTPDQVIAYHLVTEGHLLLQVRGAPPRRIAAGDVILLPLNDWHTMMSEEGVASVIGDDLVRPAENGELARIDFGGGGEPTRMLCGFLASNGGRSALIDALPRLLILPLADVAALDWVEASMRMAARELLRGHFASTAINTQLSELLLVEALRRYCELEDVPSGWLRGMCDPQIGRALALLHGDLVRCWTIDALAKEVGMSRSAFVDRFTSLIGTPPIRYLAELRLEKAKGLLQETQLTTSEIAHLVGYEAPVAFNRAFKRMFGNPPAVWRAQQHN